MLMNRHIMPRFELVARPRPYPQFGVHSDREVLDASSRLPKDIVVACRHGEVVQGSHAQYSVCIRHEFRGKD